MAKSSQDSMELAYTLFPDFVALVPFETIAGDSSGSGGSITDFGAITKSNSFIINDESADSDLILSEEGITISHTRTGAAIKAFDAGGLGDADDVTTERTLQITIAVNGFNHDIWAIQMGYNPKTDLENNFPFQKGGSSTVASAGLKLRANIKKQKYLFIARIPLAEGGSNYFVAPYTTVIDQENPIPIKPEKVASNIVLKGLKLLNSEQLDNINDIFGVVQNGYDLLFSFNENDETYSST